MYINMKIKARKSIILTSDSLQHSLVSFIFTHLKTIICKITHLQIQYVQNLPSSIITNVKETYSHSLELGRVTLTYQSMLNRNWQFSSFTAITNVCLIPKSVTPVKPVTVP